MPPVEEETKPFFIAVPTNDGRTIFPKMLGMAKYFHVYSPTDGTNFTFNEKRANPHEVTMQHLKTLDVYAVIADCKIIVAGVIGKKGIERLKNKGVELYFRKGDIQEALASVFRERLSKS